MNFEKPGAYAYECKTPCPLKIKIFSRVKKIQGRLRLNNTCSGLEVGWWRLNDTKIPLQGLHCFKI
jgi:hypothetical protein